MGTKLQAADVACRAGIDTIIAAGNRPGVIADVMESVSVGTRFHAQESPLENRKRWIFGAPPAGEISVDAGATRAILERGSSLLPKASKPSRETFPAVKLSASAIAKVAILPTASAAITAMRAPDCRPALAAD